MNEWCYNESKNIWEDYNSLQDEMMQHEEKKEKKRRHTLRSLRSISASLLLNAPHLGAQMEIIHGLGSHERQFHVRVRVYATRDDQLVGCVDHSDPRRDR